MLSNLVLQTLPGLRFFCLFFFKQRQSKWAATPKSPCIIYKKSTTNIVLQPRFSQHNKDITLRSRAPPWSSTAEPPARTHSAKTSGTRRWEDLLSKVISQQETGWYSGEGSDGISSEEVGRERSVSGAARRGRGAEGEAGGQDDTHRLDKHAEERSPAAIT